MSRFISHSACGKCGSRDNLAIYDDGSKWCFGCGFYHPPTKQAKLNSFRKKDTKKQDVISLPFDFTYALPSVATKWLNKYKLTSQEIEQHGFGWTERQQALVMPIYDVDQRVRYYQLRYFGEQAKQRYRIFGNKNDYHNILYPGNTSGSAGFDVIVVVEDIISAIKVSRQYPCLPLFGKNVSQEVLSVIAGRFKQLVIWLDVDMAKSALKQSWRFSGLFDDGARIVVTDRDPKEMTDREIKDKIDEKTVDTSI